MLNRMIPVAIVFAASLLFSFPCYGSGTRESSSGKPRETKRRTTAAPLAVVPDMQSRYGPGLTFIGVSARLSKREDSVKAALRDAARQLSFFNGLKGKVQRSEHIGGEVLDYHRAVDYQFEYDEELETYLEQLEYDSERDVFEVHNAIFVIARTSVPVSMPPLRGHSSGPRPSWVDSPPEELGGFPAGVGFSNRRSSHKDTVITSYEYAVLEIIESMESHISGRYEIEQNNSGIFDFDMTTDGVAESSIALKYFYLIESWTDPSNLAVWTLAIAKPQQTGFQNQK